MCVCVCVCVFVSVCVCVYTCMEVCFDCALVLHFVIRWAMCSNLKK